MNRPNTAKLEALTGLRLFLALNIINYHFGQPMFASAPWWLRNFVEAGYVGTGFFFVLSGFVISYVYLDLHGKRKLEPRKFWIARFSRLYPIYLLGILAWIPFLPEKLLEGPRTAFTAVGVLLTVPTLTQSWFPGVACVWNCPGWSTSADLSMYLLFPLIATYVQPRIAVTRFKHAALWLTGFWLLALLPPSLYMFAEASGEFSKGHAFWLAVLKYHPLSRLPEFMVGMVLAKRFQHDLETAWLNPKRRTALAWWGTAGVIVIFAVMAFASSFPYPLLHNGLLLPVIAVVAYSFAASVGPISRWLEYKPFQHLGETSFCMYILHNPIFEYVYRGLTILGVNTNEGKASWFFALYLIVVMVVSWFAYHRIEVPARDRLRRWLEPGQVWREDLRHWAFNAGRSGRRALRPALWILACLSLTTTGVWMARAWNAPTVSELSKDVLLDGAENLLATQSDGWLKPQAINLETSPSLVYLHENEYAPGYNLRAEFDGDHAGILVGSKYAVALNGEYLIWGEVRSGQLQIQGVRKASTANTLHALEVRVNENAIQARLDGALLLEHWRVPLEAGRVGLIANDVNVFTRLEVIFSNARDAHDAHEAREARTGNAVDIGSPVTTSDLRLRERFDRAPTEANWRILAGDWTLQDAAFVQRDRGGYDRALEYRDSFTPPYTIKTRLRHLSGAGAGLLFGLPDAELGLNAGRGGAQMVRYADDGRSLSWGFFDARGAFIGQGYAPTPTPGTTWHELEVQVERETYSVVLDGQPLQAGIPVKRPAGRIALQTSVSSAAFDLFEVTAASPATNARKSEKAK